MNVRRNLAASMLAALLALTVLPAGSRAIPTDGAPGIDCQQPYGGPSHTARQCPGHDGDLAPGTLPPVRERRIRTMAVR